MKIAWQKCALSDVTVDITGYLLRRKVAGGNQSQPSRALLLLMNSRLTGPHEHKHSTNTDKTNSNTNTLALVEKMYKTQKIKPKQSHCKNWSRMCTTVV